MYGASSELHEFLAAGHLGIAPVPPELATSLELRSNCCWSSRTPPHWPYLVEKYIAEALRGRERDYVLLAHAGHGANSYAIHYFLVRGPLALFVQVGWGGAYMDPDESSGNVAKALKSAERLIKAAELADQHLGRAVVVAREFYGSWWQGPSFELPAEDSSLPLEMALTPPITDCAYCGMAGVIRVIEEANMWFIGRR